MKWIICVIAALAVVSNTMLIDLSIDYPQMYLKNERVHYTPQRPTLSIVPKDIFEGTNAHSLYKPGDQPDSKIVGKDKWLVITLPLSLKKTKEYIWIPFVVDAGSHGAYLCNSSWEKLSLKREPELVEMPNTKMFTVHRSVNQFKEINVIGNVILKWLDAKFVINYKTNELSFFINAMHSKGFPPVFYDNEQLNIISEKLNVLREENTQELYEIANQTHEYYSLLDELNRIKELYDIKSKQYDDIKKAYDEKEVIASDNILQDIPIEVQFQGVKVNHTRYIPMENPYYEVKCKESSSSWKKESTNVNDIGEIYVGAFLRPRISLPVRSSTNEFIWVPFLIDTGSPDTYICPYTIGLLGYGFNSYIPDRIEIAGKQVYYRHSGSATVNISVNNVLGTNFLNDAILILDYFGYSISLMPAKEEFAINWPPKLMDGLGKICLIIDEYIYRLQVKLFVQLEKETKGTTALVKKIAYYKDRTIEKEELIRQVTDKLENRPEKPDL